MEARCTISKQTSRGAALQCMLQTQAARSRSFFIPHSGTDCVKQQNDCHHTQLLNAAWGVGHSTKHNSRINVHTQTCLSASNSISAKSFDLCISGVNQSQSNSLHMSRKSAEPRKKVCCQARANPSNESLPAVTQSPDYALGRVLAKSPEGSGWWDSKAAACPAVMWLDDGSWRMYYYGRGGDMWGQGVKAMTAPPMGWIGTAESSDGISWRKIKGPLSNFAVLGPDEDANAFDCVVVGSSDVLIRPGGEFWLYYFGGDLGKTGIGKGLAPVLGAAASANWGKGAGNVVKGIASFFPGQMTGLHWQIGLARSKDGLNFSRKPKPILQTGSPGEWDSLYVGWPKVVPPEEGKGDTWLMTYHSLDQRGLFQAAAATSKDGLTWQKRGRILGAGERGTWDELGVGVRHVIRINGRLAMFYEAVDKRQVHAIGLAWSDDGLRWEKDTQCGREPGGPVFRPRTDEDAWDNRNVGTPHVVALDDGSYRLYYVGVSKSVEFAIGLAVSDGPNVREWKRYGD